VIQRNLRLFENFSAADGQAVGVARQLVCDELTVLYVTVLH